MRYLTILFLLICLSLSAIDNVSIYEIQFTSKAVDGTFPSSYKNKEVMTKGVVTGVNSELNNAFIQNKSGAWQGLMIQGNTSKLKVGDLVEVKGVIKEKNGMTYLRMSSAITIAKFQNIPTPVNISSFELARSEEYEAVLVKLHNIVVTSTKRNSIKIKDGSGFCFARNNLGLKQFNFNLKQEFDSLAGIVTFSYGNFAINPRFVSDYDSKSRQITSTSWGKVKSMYK